MWMGDSGCGLYGVAQARLFFAWVRKNKRRGPERKQKLGMVGGRTDLLESMLLFGFGKGFRPQEIDGFYHPKGLSYCAGALPQAGTQRYFELPLEYNLLV
ncbi:hypothetical protein [Desulfatibacillum alkenivorans]|jgi:hypothetical protein|uniref:hypothetical protein n=1 Tax=Desulfatibacillum alkenivorans TaxID=259354 RepID=UPI001114F30A|nr:hypothetical protein [Desulfatibacillum alkenivorans]